MKTKAMKIILRENRIFNVIFKMVLVVFLFIIFSSYSKADIEGTKITFAGHCFNNDIYPENEVRDYKAAYAGDVDGDGRGDVMIGVPSDNNWTGKVYLFLGSTISTLGENINLSDADYTFIGPGDFCNIGGILGTVGDVDGDGLDDIFIGFSGIINPGADVYLVLGRSLGLPGGEPRNLVTADYKFRGWSISADGSPMVTFSGIGDVDGDLKDDFIIGDPYYDIVWYESIPPHGSRQRRIQHVGRVYLFLGGNLGVAGAPSRLVDICADYIFTGENEDEHIYAVSAGDVDGDGRGDVLIGSPSDNNDTGKVYLFRGVTIDALGENINLSDADYTFAGPAQFSKAGGVLGSAGDVDGDGLDDIFIGFSGVLPPGQDVYIVLGRSLGLPGGEPRNLVTADYKFHGWSIWNNDDPTQIITFAGIGDVDGDLKDDFIIGDPNYDKVWFENIPPQGAVERRVVNAGRAYLFLGGNLGAPGALSRNVDTAECKFIGDNPGDRCGKFINIAGDIDADGLSEIIISTTIQNYLIFSSTLGKMNLGFEFGNFAFWKRNNLAVNAQNAEVKTSMGAVVRPAEGAFMGFVSNSGKPAEQEVIITTPWIKIPANANTLTYRWYLLTNEKPAANNLYNDTLTVRKEVEGIAPINIAFMRVNSLAFPVRNVPGYLNGSGWKISSNNVQNNRGQRIRLHFAIKNVRDGSTATAVLLDDVRVQ